MSKSKLYSEPKFMERLNELIYVRNNLSASEVGRIIGCDRKTIYAWISGASAPNAMYVSRLCRFFRVSADWLLGLVD